MSVQGYYSIINSCKTLKVSLNEGVVIEIMVLPYSELLGSF